MTTKTRDVTKSVTVNWTELMRRSTHPHVSDAPPPDGFKTAAQWSTELGLAPNTTYARLLMGVRAGRIETMRRSVTMTNGNSRVVTLYRPKLEEHRHD